MAQQFSRRILRARAVEAEPSPPATLEIGPRAEELANAVRAHEALREPEAYATEIRKLWTEASRKFLAIGEYLLQAQRAFKHGDKMRRLQELLPFSYSTANRLMRVAEAVQERRLRREQLPAHYPTAYALTTLSDEELREAERRNLVSPDVQRRQIEEFIREIRGTRPPATASDYSELNPTAKAWQRAEEAIRAACNHVAGVPGAEREHEELCRLAEEFRRRAAEVFMRAI
jgi:hypothetical protein